MRRGQRVVDPNDEPLDVTPMSELTAWHSKALELRAQGLSYRKIAAVVDRTYLGVYLFFNPDYASILYKRNAQKVKEKRKIDKAFDQSIRSYTRRYMQYRAPERWAKADEEKNGGKSDS